MQVTGAELQKTVSAAGTQPVIEYCVVSPAHVGLAISHIFGPAASAVASFGASFSSCRTALSCPFPQLVDSLPDTDIVWFDESKLPAFPYRTMHHWPAGYT